MPQDERDYIIEKTRKRYLAWLNSEHTQEEALDRAYYDPKEFRSTNIANVARNKPTKGLIINWFFVIVLLAVAAVALYQNQKFRNVVNVGIAELDYKIGKALAEGGWGAISRNSVEAAKWFTEAAALGNRDAQYSLGRMYSSGQGVVQDQAEALRWYKLSAEQGHSSAQNELGIIYANGQTAPKNYSLGYLWLNLSAANGNSSAEKSRDLIAARMNPKQLAEAQKLAKKCLESNYKDCD